MSNRSKTHPAAPLQRTDRRIADHDRDPYDRSGKLPDPTVCVSCGLMFRDGRWTRGSPAVDAHRTTCPACQRVEDDLPAGLVRLEGEFALEHRDEIVALARNVTERDSAEHPLKRIMHVSPIGESGYEIATTDARLARAIAEAIQRAYKGELHYQFEEPENPFRAHWNR